MSPWGVWTRQNYDQPSPSLYKDNSSVVYNFHTCKSSQRAPIEILEKILDSYLSRKPKCVWMLTLHLIYSLSTCYCVLSSLNHCLPKYIWKLCHLLEGQWGVMHMGKFSLMLVVWLDKLLLVFTLSSDSSLKSHDIKHTVKYCLNLLCKLSHTIELWYLGFGPLDE